MQCRHQPHVCPHVCVPLHAHHNTNGKHRATQCEFHRATQCEFQRIKTICTASIEQWWVLSYGCMRPRLLSSILRTFFSVYPHVCVCVTVYIGVRVLRVCYVFARVDDRKWHGGYWLGASGASFERCVATGRAICGLSFVVHCSNRALHVGEAMSSTCVLLLPGANDLPCIPLACLSFGCLLRATVWIREHSGLRECGSGSRCHLSASSCLLSLCTRPAPACCIPVK